MAGRNVTVDGPGTRPAGEEAGTAARLAANVGVTLLWIGLQLLGLAVLLLLRRGNFPTATPVLVGAAAATAAGWALLSGGSHHPSTVGATLVGAARTLRPGVVVGAVLVTSLMPAVTDGLGRTSLPAIVAGGQVVLVAVVLRSSAHRDGPPSPVRPWAPASALVSGFLAASLMTSAFGLDDVYPFSSYPMYSAARVGEYQVERVTFEAFTEEGDRVPLRRPASRQVLRRLVAAEDHDRLTRMAHEATRGRSYARVEVATERVRVAPYPAPVGVEIVERTLVIDVEMDGGDA